MEFVEAVVAYLDILGYSALVERDVKDDARQTIDRLKPLVDSLANECFKRGLQFRQFSDSIVIAAPITAQDALKTIVLCAETQWSFLTNEFLIRGAVSIGRHYDDQRTLYSAGLVNAHRLESKMARYPRILIDNELIAWLTYQTEWKELKHQFESLCLIDFDELVFCDYARGRSATKHHDSAYALWLDAESVAGKPVTGEVLLKYDWLNKYHNYHFEKTHGNPILLPTLRKWDAPDAS